MQLNKLSIAIFTTAFAGILNAATITTILPNSDSIKWVDAKEMPEGAKVAMLMGNASKHEPFIALLKLPAGYSVPVHSHPVNEYDTVLSGTYNIGTGNVIEAAKTIALPAGSFISVPAKTIHYGFAKEETIIQITGVGPWGMIYTNPNAARKLS